MAQSNSRALYNQDKAYYRDIVSRKGDPDFLVVTLGIDELNPSRDAARL